MESLEPLTPHLCHILVVIVEKALRSWRTITIDFKRCFLFLIDSSKYIGSHTQQLTVG